MAGVDGNTANLQALTNPCSIMTVAVCLTAGRAIIGPNVLPAFPTPPAIVVKDIFTIGIRKSRNMKEGPINQNNFIN